MNPFKLASALLAYPTEELQSAWRDEVLPVLGSYPAQLLPVIQYLADTDIIELQENYVATFDRNPNHSLHLFEHLHGESRERGSAMVNLLQEYQAQGFEPTGYELPDYLPLFLEFLSLQERSHAESLLSDAVHVIGYVRGKLQDNQSIYTTVFDFVIEQSPVAPEALKVAPVRDMDEALETFGASIDGIEPLLNPMAACKTAATATDNGVQVVNIRPRSHA